MWKSFIEKLKNLFKKKEAVVVAPAVSSTPVVTPAPAVVPVVSIPKESSVSDFPAKGTLILDGPGRGGYADGKGGFTKVNPLDGGNPDFDPSKIKQPTEQERALFEAYTQGPTGDGRADALAQLEAIATANGESIGVLLARASGHQ